MTALQRFDPCGVPLRGVSLVEASAGTGKTYAITTLFVRLLLERDLPIDQVLVVTFTEAATAELRDRVRTRLRQAIAAFEAHAAGRSTDDAELKTLVERSPDPSAARSRLEVALRDADLAAIYTIHGFCHRVLKDSAFESGVLFDADILTDLQPLRDEVVGDFWAARVAELPHQVVAGLLDAKLGLASFRALADKALRHPDAPVSPVAGAVVELPFEEFEAALRATGELWDEAIVLGLLADDALNKNRYKPASVARWCAAMSAYFEQPPDVPRLLDKHDKFCASTIADSCKKNRQPPTHPFFEACDRMRDVHRRCVEASHAQMLALHAGLVDYVRTEVPRRKEAACVLSFDDLLLQLHAALDGDRGAALARSVRRRFPAALVDEFQDTDPVQYEIFARIWNGEDAGMFFVGDPKQAIYSFRGADVFAYMKAAAATAEDRRFTMGFNWRSDPRLVSAINFLYGRVDRPFLLEDIDYHEVEARPGAADAFSAGPLEILFVRRGDDKNIDGLWLRQRHADLVAAEISTLLRSSATIDGRPVVASDVAVLTRTNNQAFEVQNALRALRIPSVVLGDQSVFESREAGELQRVLASVVEPGQGGALRAALTTELLGVTGNDLAAMEEDEAAWTAWVHAFREWNELWTAKGFVQMFRAFMAHGGLQARLLSLQDGERRMTNVLHLMELLHTAATTQHLGPTGLLHWLAQQRAHARARPEAAQIRLESDEKAVVITTVHRSKGLEYGIVYCPDLWDGLLLHPDDEKVLMYHDPADGDRLALHVEIPGEPRGPSHERAEWEKLAENLRLLYVALTRAKHRCTVFWGARWKYEQSALGYLLHPRLGIAGFGVQSLRDHLKSLSDDQMLAELEDVAAASEGRVAVRVLDPEQLGVVCEPEIEDRAELVRRQPAQPIERWWRTASFSGLTRGAAVLQPDAAEGRDRDDVVEDDPASGLRSARGAPIVLADFPRGARAGNFFHYLLERLDFAASAADRTELVRRGLAAHGYSAERHEASVQQALDEVLAAPLRGELCLADIGRAKRLDELEFHVPVAQPDGREDAGVFTQRRLAGAFRDHPSAELAGDYAERSGRLRFSPLRGFLKGYIDLVFEHGGLWYVVDYKTNYLGPCVEDYGAGEMTAAMSHGHYYLQYHLYTVAVHRYLARRVPGWDYRESFGGVLYLFLRGMTPGRPGAGVFFEKPPLARIEALSSVLERPEPVGVQA